MPEYSAWSHLKRSSTVEYMPPSPGIDFLASHHSPKTFPNHAQFGVLHIGIIGGSDIGAKYYLKTGVCQPWTTLEPPDSAGVLYGNIVMTPDGKTSAYLPPSSDYALSGWRIEVRSTYFSRVASPRLRQDGHVWDELAALDREIVILKPSYGAFYDSPLGGC